MASHASLFTTASCAALLLACGPAFAQTAPTPTAQADDTEVVIVTARKRTENLQDVPLTISVLNAAAIARKGIDSADDVASLTPGLTFDVGLVPTDTRIAIRGVQAVRGRPNVAILVDGIDTSSENFSVAGGGILANLRLVDVERIEVVKGPQSVLYGRSAFAGAVNYISRRPSREREATLTAEIGSHGLQEIKGAFGGPVGGEQFRVRGNFAVMKQDGDYKSDLGFGLNGSSMWGGAIAAVYEPNDKFNAYFRIQHSNEEYDERAAVLLRSVNPFNGDPNTPDGGAILPTLRPGRPLNIYTIRGDVSQSAAYRSKSAQVSGDPNNGNGAYPGTKVETTRAGLQLVWNTDLGEFRSNSGFLKNKSSFNEDFDHTNYRLIGNEGVAAYAAGGAGSTLNAFRQGFGWPLPYLPAYGLSGEFDANVEIEQVTQEVLWAKDFGRVRALVDGLIWHENATYNDKSVFWLREGGNQTLGAFLSFAQGQRGFHLGAPPAGGATTPQRITRETDSASLAISLGFKITETLNLDVEGRYIKDEITYTGLNFDPFVVNTYGATPGGFVRSDPPVETEKFTPRVNVSWKAMDKLLIFGTYAQGTKPAGVDTTDQNGNVNDGRFLPESIDTYELGAKFSNAAGNFTINSSLFLNLYHDQQIGIIQTVNGVPQSSTVNIGESETQGFEFEANWRSNSHLSFRAAYTNTAAEFTEYLLPRCGPVDSAESMTANCDFKGKKIPFTPEHQASVSARYQRPISNGMFFIESDTRYLSDRFLSASNLAWLPAYTQTDIRGGIEAASWSVTAYVDNLFADDSPRTGTSSVDYGYLDLNSNQLPRGYLIALAPKTKFGVRFNKDF